MWTLAAKDYWSAFTTSLEAVLSFRPLRRHVLVGARCRSGPVRAGDGQAWSVGPGRSVGGASLGGLHVAAGRPGHQRRAAGRRRELYARLATLGGHAAKLGRSLAVSVEAHNALIGGLKPGCWSAHDDCTTWASVAQIAPAGPGETAARPLTAHELIDAVTATDRRPELFVDPPGWDGGRNGGKLNLGRAMSRRTSRRAASCPTFHVP